MVRRSDRIEGFMSFGLIIFAILLLPLAVWAGAATASSQNALIAKQSAELHSISATTTADSTQTTASTADYIAPTTEMASAQWNWNGQVHTGDVTVDSATPAGPEVPIYVNGPGHKTVAPNPPSAGRVPPLGAGVFPRGPGEDQPAPGGQPRPGRRPPPEQQQRAGDAGQGAEDVDDLGHGHFFLGSITNASAKVRAAAERTRSSALAFMRWMTLSGLSSYSRTSASTVDASLVEAGRNV